VTPAQERNTPVTEVPEVDLPKGRTSWRRFAVVMGAATLLAGGIVVGMANGAIAASFAVSGSSFKVKAASLDGYGFVQYGSFAPEAGGRMLADGKTPDPKDPKNHPVAVSGMHTATLTNLCQSVVMKGLPISLIIRAGQHGEEVSAVDMLIDASSLKGDATFTNMSIGQDAATLSKAGTNVPGGGAGQFGQQADKIHIDNLEQTAWATSAGTFVLKGLDLHISFNADGAPEECF
jgi:hypothetical protein